MIVWNVFPRMCSSAGLEIRMHGHNRKESPFAGRA